MRIAVGIVKLLFGLLLVGMFVGGMLKDAYKNLIGAGTFGFFTGLGVLLMASGGSDIAEKRIPSQVSWGILLILTVLGIAAGPPLSRLSHQSEEVAHWNVVKESRNPSDWDTYRYQVPKPFRRPEFEPRSMLADVTQAVKDKEAEKLRTILRIIDQDHKDDREFAPAREEATKGLAAMFRDALARLGTSRGDKKLQQAFTHIIDYLSNQSDGDVYLVFSNASSLDPPRGTGEELAYVRKAPDVLKAFPKGDAPIVDPGQAFSSAYDQKRRDTFLSAMRESFGHVFSKGLMDLLPIPKDGDPKGRIIFQVRSFIQREPGFYVRTRGEQQTPIGLMYGMHVNWEFRIVDRDGKSLYDSKTTSRPAKDVRFKLSSSDPEWAPYSILMDSAYYNYGRQIISGFGLEPPKEKTYFTFE